MRKFLIAAGARPNFIKIAPLIHELRRDDNGVAWKLIHTGQHYDYEMSEAFFDEFDLPKPDYFLNVGPGSHAEQTARIMIEFEKICLEERPDVVIVVGDVNSTLACSLTAKKLNIKVAHIEAGLRSGDMAMAEEINRIATDSISDYLFVTEKSGIANLRREGKREEQIIFTGNIMIDTLYYCLKKLETLSVEKIADPPYAVLTLHRPSNVDNKFKLEDILRAMVEISRDIPLYFPVHPRTKGNMEKFHLNNLLENTNISVLPPLPYLAFLSLWKDAALVLTDSGGIQEETTALGVACFTIRDNTERPITVEEGTNLLIGTTGGKILRAYDDFKRGLQKASRIPDLWDGRTAKRIVDRLLVG